MWTPKVAQKSVPGVAEAGLALGVGDGLVGWQVVEVRNRFVERVLHIRDEVEGLGYVESTNEKGKTRDDDRSRGRSDGGRTSAREKQNVERGIVIGLGPGTIGVGVV